MLTKNRKLHKASPQFQKNGPSLANTSRRVAGENIQNDIDKVCRICLSAAHLHQNLLTVCRCTGPLGYVHYGCIRKWITVKMKPETETVQCELCLQSLSYSINYYKVCSCQLLVNSLSQQPLRTVLIIFLYLFLLGGALSFTYLLALAKSESSQSDLKQKLRVTDQSAPLYIVALVAIYLLLIFFTFLLINTFFCKKNVEIAIFSHGEIRTAEQTQWAIRRHRHKFRRIFPRGLK